MSATYAEKMGLGVRRMVEIVGIQDRLGRNFCRILTVCAWENSERSIFSNLFFYGYIVFDECYLCWKNGAGCAQNGGDPRHWRSAVMCLVIGFR